MDGRFRAVAGCFSGTRNEFDFICFEIVKSTFSDLTPRIMSRKVLLVMLDRATKFEQITVAGAASSVIGIIGLVLIGLLEAGCGPPT